MGEPNRPKPSCPEPGRPEPDLIAALLALTERLSAALAAEAAAFEAGRPQDVARSSAETLRLANLYRHEAARLKAQPAPLAAASPALRQRLKGTTAAFEATLARHGRAVGAAVTVTEGLVEAIAREVAAARARPAGYGPAARPSSIDATAVTLNRRA